MKIFLWLCHGAMPTALRGAYGFAPAQAPADVAARTEVNMRLSHSGISVMPQ